MLEALELVIAAVAVAASMWLAWRALRELYRGAREAAHGATDARRRLWAYRMRIFTLTGLAAVSLGIVAALQRGFVAGGVLELSGGMLVFGLFAWVSARASGRASRRGDKRAHVRSRLRFHRWREQRRRRSRQDQTHDEDPAGRQQQPPATVHQAKVRQALRTLGLSKEATAEEIKRAWRKQALRHHPDRHASTSEARREEHAEAFRRARRAYETLTDRAER